MTDTLLTLSGGLVAVLVLYALGGRVPGLPPALRALLAGLLPLLGYFLLIVGRWPGLDVAAIHISVFLAAGLVLHVITQFRQRSGGRLHWAPRLLIAFFLGLVVLNGTLLYIATQGLPDPVARWWLSGDGTPVHSGFSGVVQHGQQAAKAVSSELAEAHREARFGWQVELTGLDDNARTHQVRLRVRDRTGLPVEGIEARLRLLRLGAAQPTLELGLDARAAGVYEGLLALPAAGRWVVDVRLLRDGIQYYHATREVLAP